MGISSAGLAILASPIGVLAMQPAWLVAYLGSLAVAGAAWLGARRIARRLAGARLTAIAPAEAASRAACEPRPHVRVRGRVRTLIPALDARPRVAVVVRAGVLRAGRFRVELDGVGVEVDDDQLLVLDAAGDARVAYATLRDGDEVVVDGPARRIDAPSSTHRTGASRLVLDGTPSEPVRVWLVR